MREKECKISELKWKCLEMPKLEVDPSHGVSQS